MKFLDVLQALEETHARQVDDLAKLQCPTCIGSGKCDDMDIGDIMFNTWPCEDCKGTGWLKGKQE